MMNQIPALDYAIPDDLSAQRRGQHQLFELLPLLSLPAAEPPPSDSLAVAPGNLPPLPAALNAAALASIMADPCHAGLLAKLRAQAEESYAAMVDDTCRLLMAADAQQSVADAGNSSDTAIDLRQLIAASRRREWQGRLCRQDAEALIAGRLHNTGNPAWDPCDAGSSSDQSGNVFLTLLTSRQ